MESDSEESIDTTELEHNFLVTTAAIEEMLASLDQLELRMDQIHRPLQDLYVDQLGNLDYLATSPFRTHTFQFANPAVATLAGLDPEKRHTYGHICEKLRDALFATGSINPEGRIQLPPHLKKLFHIKQKEVSFFTLLGALRAILI